MKERGIKCYHKPWNRRDIRFCPICGRKLYGYEDTERCEE